MNRQTCKWTAISRVVISNADYRLRGLGYIYGNYNSLYMAMSLDITIFRCNYFQWKDRAFFCAFENIVLYARDQSEFRRRLECCGS